MAKNLETLDYKGYLLLLALGGLLPFSAFNMLALAILSIRLGIIHFNASTRLNAKYISAYFILCAFFLVMTYHLILNEFRPVWIARYFLLSIAIYFIISNPIQISVRSINLISAIVALYIIADIYQLISKQALFLNGQYRTYGLSLGRIVFSNFVITICFLLILLYEEKNTLSRIQLIYINILKLLCFVHVYLSGSRSFLLAILCLAFLRRWIVSRHISKVLIIASMILIFLVLQHTNERFATIFDTSFGSNYSRLLFVEHGLSLWDKNFYFGSGPGKSIDYLSTVIDEDMPALHFDILLIASELGLFGIGVFFFLLYQMKNSKNIIIPTCLFLLSLQNSIYYTSYILFIILAIEGLNVRKNV